MLQCVAVCCSVLQCVAVCRSVWQCVAVCCSVLQCVAVCRSVLQCLGLAVLSEVSRLLMYPRAVRSGSADCRGLQYVAV